MDNEQRASVPNNELGETALAMVMGLVNNTETPPAETPAPAPPVQPPAAPPVQPPAAPPVQPPAAPPAQPVQEVPVLTTDMMADRFSGAPQTPPMSELPDIPAEQSITLPNNTPENVGHAFAASRAEARRYRELAEDMRKQLEAERGQREDYSKKEAEFTRRLAEAQQRQTDLENQIGQLDLAQSREFRDKYDAPVQGVCDDIAKVLVQNGATPQDAQAQAEEILSTSDVAPLLTELPATAQGMVMYKLEEAKSLLAQREAALNEWRTTQQGLAEVSLRDSAIVSAQRRAEVADAAFDRLKAIAPTMQWNDPEYAPRRDAAVAKAKAWYQTAPEDQIAAAAMEGFLAPFAYEELNRLTQQNRELRELLAGRARMASPPVAPLYPSAPIIAPPAPPPPTPGTPGQPWSPADSEVDSLRSATRIVESLAAAR